MRCFHPNCDEPAHFEGLCVQDYLKAQRGQQTPTDEATEATEPEEGNDD